jgi:hypothetical protein
MTRRSNTAIAGTRSSTVSETKFYCSVARVQTMADGGLRVYLDLPEDAIVPAAEMMAYKRHGTAVDVVMTPREQDEPEGESFEL